MNGADSPIYKQRSESDVLRLFTISLLLPRPVLSRGPLDKDLVVNTKESYCCRFHSKNRFCIARKNYWACQPVPRCKIVTREPVSKRTSSWPLRSICIWMGLGPNWPFCFFTTSKGMCLGRRHCAILSHKTRSQSTLKQHSHRCADPELIKQRKLNHPQNTISQKKYLNFLIHIINNNSYLCNKCIKHNFFFL